MPAVTYPRIIPIPYDAKIADILEADTSTHLLDLATALSESRKIVSINLSAVRISGTGQFRVYNNEETQLAQLSGSYISSPVMLADGTNRLKYAQSVSKDDFDLYCTGYWVEA